MIDSQSSKISPKIKTLGKLFIDKFKNNFVYTLGSVILIISGFGDIPDAWTACGGFSFEPDACQTSKLVAAFGSTKIALGLILLGNKKY